VYVLIQIFGGFGNIPKRGWAQIFKPVHSGLKERIRLRTCAVEGQMDYESTGMNRDGISGIRALGVFAPEYPRKNNLDLGWLSSAMVAAA